MNWFKKTFRVDPDAKCPETFRDQAIDELGNPRMPEFPDDLSTPEEEPEWCEHCGDRAAVATIDCEDRTDTDRGEAVTHYTMNVCDECRKRGEK